MEIENKHIETDKFAAHAIDGMELLDSMSDSEVKDFLSDKETATYCNLLLKYREAKIKQTLHKPDSSKAWMNFKKNHILPNKEHRHYRLVLTYTISIAAAMILFLLVIRFHNIDLTNSNKQILAFTANNNPKVIMMAVNEKDPQPITNQNKPLGAIINDNEADFSHARASSMSMRTISTPRGKDYKVVLSDGTVVLLNADSKLIFPTHFSGKERNVKLIGEAYFKVTHDSSHPFTVRTEKLRTRVLGTEFNLKAYPNSDTHVTLIKGFVIVDSNSKNEEVKLKPGQDATLKENQDFNVTTVDTEYYIQWKEGYFYFDDLPLIDVVKELGRWYNVNIEICDNSLMSYRLHFIAERDASISEVVQNLNEFSYLSVTQEGRKIIISKKN